MIFCVALWSYVFYLGLPNTFNNSVFNEQFNSFTFSAHCGNLNCGHYCGGQSALQKYIALLNNDLV